ncbi:DUF6049 family protein [Bifidobacterium avesanii]|uniref:Uncharacterized protein n=1 Tax=Bifidobacterium avesanii TaxID=1798157 RepID=A0A7K3TK72_9BIFI|nr:DUF6049 family protein [Bifidobacterium avesanii]KAB8291994.1 hypothetical protein DSM100685_1006 [Bifidobacterium avesanii]NEG78643.1 hypothetical protein [Bifidobacterium avesanii]
MRRRPSHAPSRGLAGRVCAMLAALILVVVPTPALADDGATGTGTSGTGTTGATTTTTAPCENAVCITATALTPVVTATSGYQATVTVTNATAQDIAQATLSVATNALYTFSSRVDMQAWAEGETNIPTRNVLGTAAIANLAAGSSAQAQVTVPADSDQLKAITTWGPKPLRISLDSGAKATNASLCSFLTRSTDGLRSADTPPLKIVMAMPLTAGSWNIDPTAFKALVSGDESAKIQADSIAASDADQRAAQTQLIAQHPDLQVVADPSYLATFGSSVPSVAATMQNGFFDITAAGTQTDADYDAAGITDDDWKAEADDAVAWQGQGAWTLEALTRAARQGYTTVIANADFESSSTAAAHTGVYDVPTEAGDVTVLASQTTLTRLAQNQASSQNAAAETTEAGQMARFVAQSAFYQMEQPYADRILLVTFAPGMSADHVSRMMSAMEEASWVSLTDLSELTTADAYRSGNRAVQALPQESGVNEQTTAAMRDALSALATARSEINRFATKVLVANSVAADDSTATPSGSASASASASGTPSSAATSDTQALARQDAAATAHRGDDASSWISQLNAAQHRLATLALDGAALNHDLATQSKGLSDELFQGISISPSDSINVVSETAQMPVTVSNSHDFPVRVTVSSKTDSMQIVTSREVDTVVPAHGEVQVTFAIRVLTSGRATAHLALQDTDGDEFGAAHETHISSRLQMSDMSGMAIVVLAVILGLWGLWRQFHRKKDPDE